MAVIFCALLTLEKVGSKLPWYFTVVNYRGIFITLALGNMENLKNTATKTS
jgi:hypothetical protein